MIVMMKIQMYNLGTTVIFVMVIIQHVLIVWVKQTEDVLMIVATTAMELEKLGQNVTYI